MEKLIKIYGERNTSTNYMSNLIRLNLVVREIPGTVPPFIVKIQKLFPGNELIRDMYFYLTYKNNLGWKHTRVQSIEILKKYNLVKNNLALITITKNPYAWLLSLHRRPYHQRYAEKPDFETFLQLPWKTTRRENTKPVLENPIELWNIKNSSYLHLKELGALNITSESILENPESAIDNISSHFSIKKSAQIFIGYEQSTKEKNKNSHYYRDYYLKEKWRDLLTKKSISTINRSLDKELMGHFGYEILT